MIIALNDEVVRMGGGMLHKDVPNNTLDANMGYQMHPREFANSILIRNDESVHQKAFHIFEVTCSHNYLVLGKKEITVRTPL